MNEEKKILRIALDVPLGKYFDYYPSKEEELNPDYIGRRFLVPFRAGVKIGILVDIVDEPTEKEYTIKTAIKCIDENKFLDRGYLDFLEWVAKYYLFDEGRFLFFCLPNFFLEEKPITLAENKKMIFEPNKRDSFKLTEAQQNVATKIKQFPDGFSTHLLYGETGSGKTFVYLDILLERLLCGGQVLFLLPEINLVDYLVPILQKYLDFPVVAYHSGVGKKARRQIWDYINTGLPILVVGTRSSLFLAWKNLSLIIVDEEHDNSYRQSHSFAYDARDLAVKLAQTCDIKVILGSATISLRSLHNAENSKYEFYQLASPSSKNKQITLVELEKREIFHPTTKKMIKEELSSGNNVLLFLNRKGYTPVLFCKSCKKTITCPNCEVNLVYYHSKKKMVCNFCDFSKASPSACECSGDLVKIGSGTERIEEMATELFKGHSVFRIDGDNVGSVDLELIYSELSSGNLEGNILLGTQILAKGHNFASLSLVVIMDMDSYLYSADIFMSENFIQLLYQVSGRTGRFGESGKVVLQTRFPKQPLIELAKNKDYLDVAKVLLEKRKDYGLPPYNLLCMLVISSKKQENAIQFSRHIYKFLSNHKLGSEVKIGENLPFSVEKKRGEFFWYISLLGKSKYVRMLALEVKNISLSSKDCKLAINFDIGFVN